MWIVIIIIILLIPLFLFYRWLTDYRNIVMFIANTYNSIADEKTSATDKEVFIEALRTRYTRGKDTDPGQNYSLNIAEKVIDGIRTVDYGIEKYDILLLCLVCLVIEGHSITADPADAYIKVKTNLIQRGLGDQAVCSFEAALNLLAFVLECKGFQITE